VGAGNRGHAYAQFALDNPQRLEITGVAEPRAFHRERMATLHNIPSGQVFDEWQALAERPQMADAAIVATPDALHTEPAVALAERGYHLLLEKPMAPTAAECVRIVDEVTSAGVLFAVCHVLRYTDYTKRIREIVDSGALGSIVSMQHLEPVGFWHYAHSFVRGNWRNEAESSFMLLAKSCHDLDWIHYLMGERCQSVSSFGHLNHFRAKNKPEGAGTRCVACPVEGSCPYSAVRIYIAALRCGNLGWPVNVVAPEPTEVSLRAALAEGPYGRCVYECDNDVVDNQTVIIDFENGKTADFSMVAFTPHRPSRQTQIFGTRGHLWGDSAHIRTYDFLPDTHEEIDTLASLGDIRGGHGGGDTAIMEHFVTALATGDASHILSGPAETLESHLMVFAAEQARRERRVVDMSEVAGYSSTKATR
jgi:predicted dehydrogenase